MDGVCFINDKEFDETSLFKIRSEIIFNIILIILNDKL